MLPFRRDYFVLSFSLHALAGRFGGMSIVDTMTESKGKIRMNERTRRVNVQWTLKRMNR